MSLEENVRRIIVARLRLDPATVGTPEYFERVGALRGEVDELLNTWRRDGMADLAMRLDGMRQAFVDARAELAAERAINATLRGELHAMEKERDALISARGRPAFEVIEGGRKGDVA